jgi:transposase
VDGSGDAVVAFASRRSALARCPQCREPSARVHGRYQRLVADGAAGGRPLLIALSVRRFRCTSPSCLRVTFVEQAEGLTGRYLRRTLPLRELLARFGLELAGRAGALFENRVDHRRRKRRAVGIGSSQRAFESTPGGAVGGEHGGVSCARGTRRARRRWDSR